MYRPTLISYLSALLPLLVMGCGGRTESRPGIEALPTCAFDAYVEGGVLLHAFTPIVALSDVHTPVDVAIDGCRVGKTSASSMERVRFPRNKSFALKVSGPGYLPTRNVDFPPIPSIEPPGSVWFGTLALTEDWVDVVGPLEKGNTPLLVVVEPGPECTGPLEVDVGLSPHPKIRYVSLPTPAVATRVAVVQGLAAGTQVVARARMGTCTGAALFAATLEDGYATIARFPIGKPGG